MPMPSRAPEDVTDTEDTIKPALMMRRAAAPAWLVSGFSVKSPIRRRGTVRQTRVPATMMTAHMARVTL